MLSHLCAQLKVCGNDGDLRAGDDEDNEDEEEKAEEIVELVLPERLQYIVDCYLLALSRVLRR